LEWKCSFEDQSSDISFRGVCETDAGLVALLPCSANATVSRWADRSGKGTMRPIGMRHDNCCWYVTH
jgi:hypothetical protein